MTASLVGHPVSDIRSILNNGWGNASGPVTLSYIFQSQVSVFTYDYNLAELAAADQITFRQIVDDGLTQMTVFTGVNFTEAADAGDPTSHIAFRYTPGLQFGGEAFHNYWSRDGDADVETIRSTVDIRVYNHYTVLHELGHAFTLLHTGPDQSPDHDPFIDAEFRNNNFTVMHYTNTQSGVAAGEWDYRFFQLIDLYALQLRFGENSTTFSGDNVHTESTLWNAQTTGFLQPLWDAGGEDMLDFSDISRAQLLDLREGHFSDVGSFQGAAPDLALSGNPFDMDYTLPLYNLSIAYNAVIENARGGSGSDMVFGNDTGNALYGMAGDDTIEGGAGNDEIYGGDGNDIIFGDGTVDITAILQAYSLA